MLDDLNVIEIGQVLAGPYAGAILADLGANVIKIEKPDGGDDGRRMGKPFLDDDSLTFHEFNRGKAVRRPRFEVGRRNRRAARTGRPFRRPHS
jgi:crotonobetainyl-CoA:carnitine CoA-transferase CaiB-like acyl-CoA transferase